jgi:TRAP-type C4-dicarboxylate transport system permease small subunit
MLKKIYFVLNRIRILGIILTLSWMVILCFIQVVLRYFTSASLRPFAWGDEVIRLTSIWTAFLAASLGVREGSHLSVDFFINKLLGPGGITILKKIILIMALASMGLLFWYGILQVYSNKDSYLQNISISIAWFYAAIPTGCFYIFFEYLLILVYGRNPFTGKTARGENKPADRAGY